MNESLIEHLSRFVGKTVTIFTTSGGASGCGFTGVLLFVNPCFVRLVIRQGASPSNPLSKSICGEMSGEDNGMMPGCGMHHKKNHHEEDFMVGSVCDIPIDKIASFCHNAI